MAKKNEIRIDLNKWCTQSQKAEAEGCTLNAISLRVFKAKKKIKPYDIFDIPELGLTLVKK